MFPTNTTVTVQDSYTAALHDDVAGIETTDGTQTINWDEVPVETIDSVPIAEHFATKKFYKLTATVAKPIKQPYVVDEDVYVFKKPADELKKAAWSLDNKPWTMGHPNTSNGLVKSTSHIDGFWKNPRYIDAVNDLDADFYIPVDNTDAKQFIEDNQDVSVGFRNTLVTADSYSGSDMTDADAIDGYQTDLYFDHVASVSNGRCSSEDGCSLATDEIAGELQIIDTSCVDSYSEGEMVEWDASGGTAMGEIDEVIEDGCTTRGLGDMEVCAKEDDPVAVIELYEDNEGTDEYVRHLMSELRSAGSRSDEMDMTPPQAAQDNAQMALDAKESTGNPNDCGTDVGWRRARQLADGGELSTETISRMSQFNRHRSNSEMSDEEGKEDCGWMMWKAWGGDEGVDWAMDMMDRMENTDAQSTYMSKEQQTVSEAMKFTEKEMAEMRAEELGCDGAHQHEDGMWMPCESMEMYMLMTDGACDKITDCPWARVENIDMSMPMGEITEGAPDAIAEMKPTEIMMAAECIEMPGCESDMSPAERGWVMEIAERLEYLHYLNKPTITNDSDDSRDTVDYTEDGSYYAISPEENTGGDDPTYPINTCNDVKDAYNLRNHGDYSISTETLVERIKRRASELDCSDASKPWTSDTETDIMTDLTDLDVSDLVDEHEGVKDLYEEVQSHRDAAETVRETLELDEDDSLVEEIDSLKTLAEKGREYQDEQIDGHVEAIMSHTDRYEEEDLRVKPIDHLAEIRAVVEDAATTSSTSVANSGTDSVESQTSKTGVVDSPWE